MTSEADSQWLFPLSALSATPTEWPIGKQLYDRARGVEFLFRLGSSLGLPTSAMFTAATWFHRLYMRYSMEDIHRQDAAAACIFLATKTEECGRKLKDVARVCQAKAKNIDVSQIPVDSQEVDQCQTAILLAEEVLLEALCFDFIVESPHSDLVDLFDSHQIDPIIQEFAWSLAHDSYRTPMCVLYPPKITATACFVLAQKLFDGNNSPSLDARISFAGPASSLPTPPSHKPASPDPSRYAINYFALTEAELTTVAEALNVLLEFYATQDVQNAPHIAPIQAVSPPSSNKPNLYTPIASVSSQVHGDFAHPDDPGRTPSSSYGGHTPLTASSTAELPKRLDLS